MRLNLALTLSVLCRGKGIRPGALLSDYLLSALSGVDVSVVDEDTVLLQHWQQVWKEDFLGNFVHASKRNVVVSFHGFDIRFTAIAM